MTLLQFSNFLKISRPSSGLWLSPKKYALAQHELNAKEQSDKEDHDFAMFVDKLNTTLTNLHK